MRAREPLIGHDGHSEVPAAEDVLSEAERETYLDALRGHVGLDLAARTIGRTGTFMRRLRRRDAVWREQVEAAEEEGMAVYRDRLRATAALRATSDRDNGGSDRLLEVELATHVGGYEHLRRNAIRIDQQTSGVILHLDPARLDELPREQLEALLVALEGLGGGIVDGAAREITAGDDESA